MHRRRAGRTRGTRGEDADVALGGVILAGGESRRMGRNKALLPVGRGTLIEVVIARLREICSDILVVTNTPQVYRHLGLRMVPDAFRGRHALIGIYTGILHTTVPAFVCGCDMPFLSPALIRHMAELADGFDAVVPRHEGRFEPLHAVYTRACLGPMRRSAEANESSTAFLREVRVRAVEVEEIRRFDPDLRSFVNLNTAEDYARALEQMRRAE